MNVLQLLVRNDVKVLITYTLVGGIVQIVARKYIRNHPEISDDRPAARKKLKLKLRRRLGKIVRVSTLSFRVGVRFVSQNGVVIGVITGGVVFLSQLPPSLIAEYLRDALPASFGNWDKEKIILIYGEKLNLTTLVKLLSIIDDDNVPIEEKERAARLMLKILVKSFDFREGAVNFVVFLVALMMVVGMSNYKLNYK